MTSPRIPYYASLWQLEAAENSSIQKPTPFTRPAVSTRTIEIFPTVSLWIDGKMEPPEEVLSVSLLEGLRFCFVDGILMRQIQ